jgi:MFS family permease
MVRLLGFVGGGLAATYVAALFVEQRICDEGTCQSVATWRWIVFGAVAVIGLGYSLGPWWRHRPPSEIARALRRPPERRRD